jgi:hypothetical protein
MDPRPASHPPDIDGIVIRATRPGDYEEIAALGNLPG